MSPTPVVVDNGEDFDLSHLLNATQTTGLNLCGSDIGGGVGV